MNHARSFLLSLAFPRSLAFLRSLVFLIVSGGLASGGFADDWLRFRGPGGSGVSGDAEPLPTQWSPKANVAWKAALPGPGVSSPIIVDDRVFVTCYSGYGLSRENPGDMKDLMRHVVCVDLQTGEKLWQDDVPAVLPEDPYAGIGVTAHGYASHTPVSDGQRLFVYFGKSGASAYDLDGKRLWATPIGTESDPWAWGSSASPVVYGDTVIVTASAESQAIVALDKTNGKEVWRQEAEGLDGMWGTPTLVKVDDERTDLVMSVAKEIWGLDPATGKLRWYSEATGAEQTHSSVISGGGLVFAFTGRGGGSVAVKVGGRGDVTDSNIVWTGRDSARFGSPVGYKSNVYLVANGVVTSIDGKTGKKIDQVRLQGAARGGGGFGSLDYPSPVVSGDKLYYLNGSGQMFVFQLGDELKQISVNRVTGDAESFGGTPAISDGRMILRSDKHLYCVTDQGDPVDPADNVSVATEDDDPAAEGRGGFGGGRGAPGGRARGGQGRGGPPGGFGGRGEGRGGPGAGGPGRGGPGRGGPGGEREDDRPDRPQRPEPAPE